MASTAATARNAVRWYELNGIRSTDNGGVPVVVQSGTIFDSAATRAAARQYSIPSVVVSGQGHAALGYTTAGTPNRIDAATNGRLAGDPLGTLQAITIYTTSSTAYNPTGDPGGTGGRRWGDYSFMSLDPIDDMTIWSVQEYCNGTNTYGCRVAKLLAPAPATPASAAPGSVAAGQSSVSVVITGTSTAGSGFYDPGTNLGGGAVNFNHVSGVVSGGVVVNSVTYTDPTHVTLNVDTTGASAGAKDVTITNPDGQSRTGVGILTITASTPALTSAVSRLNHAGVGDFDVNMPLSGTSGVEDRLAGTYNIVLTFTNGPITSGTASVTVGTGTAGSPTFSGNTMTVPISGVAGAEVVTLTVNNVNGLLPAASVDLGFLAGDTTADRSVNSADIGQTKSQSGSAVSASNFRNDVNLDGNLNSADIGLVKSKSGTALP